MALNGQTVRSPLRLQAANPMPSADTLARFIARVEQGAQVETIEAFYDPQASMQENMAAPRVGREALMAHEARAISQVKWSRARCVGPVFVNGDHVVIRWHFKIEGLDGTDSEFEELAYQQWRGERILVEQFFYDPGQFGRRPVGEAG